jgi:hypothetical protein
MEGIVEKDSILFKIPILFTKAELNVALETLSNSVRFSFNKDLFFCYILRANLVWWFRGVN